MKKNQIFIAGLCLLLASCGTMGTSTRTSSSNNSGTSVLGSILGSATNGETIGNVLGSVIGLNKVTSRQLPGTWHYSGPGCAFTSDNALASAGGEVAATEIKQKLKTLYSKSGLTSSNTSITFDKNGNFSAIIDGKSWQGTYTFREKTQQIKLHGLLLSLTGYTKRNVNGISVLFESKKLLTLLQTLSAFSGSQTLETVGDISKNYNDVRIGFDLKE